MSNCKLMDLSSIDARFTWRGPQWQGYDIIFKRLDRAPCNVEWCLRFSDAFVSTFPRVESDHHPISMTMDTIPQHQGEKPFRFLAAWMLHDDNNQVLHESWVKSNRL